jgi:hypothetical protein
MARTDVFDMKMAALDRALPKAGRELVRDLAGEWAVWVDRLSPEDTRRFVNGWAMAAKAAGVRGGPVRRLKESRYASYAEKRLTRLAARAERQYLRERANYLAQSRLYNSRYASIGRKGKWERITRKEVERRARAMEKAKAVMERARQALNEFYGQIGDGTALFIGGKGKLSKVGDIKLSNLTRVITTVYGGTGVLRDLGDASTATLHNLEPHATMVNARTKVVQYARDMVRTASRGLLRQSMTRRGVNIVLEKSQLRKVG